MHAGLRIRLDGSGHSFLRLLTGVDSPPDEDRLLWPAPPYAQLVANSEHFSFTQDIGSPWAAGCGKLSVLALGRAGRSRVTFGA
jgi:hypothetical protein